MKHRIDEAIEYLKEDLSYVAIVGTIQLSEIDSKKWKKENVEDQSFNHVFELINGGHCHDEDRWSGETLIPLSDETYLVCEWQS